MRMASKVKLLLSILLMLFAIVSIAEADTLALPGDLTVIKESAFEGDSSLDEVILGDKVERIESRAFAGTGLHMITMPESVSYIADDAFDGVDHVKVNAPEGSYAYEWAEAKGFILNDDVTVVVASETLLAGKNLDITIYGVKNTVEHNVYLINTETDEIVYRESLKQKNGKIIIKGYLMEAGIYKMIVYTITEDMGLLNPVSQTIEIVGTKPPALSFPIPEKLFRDEGFEFLIAPYEELRMRSVWLFKNDRPSYYESDSFIEYSSSDGYGNIITNRLFVETVSFYYCGYADGIWSEWSPAYNITVVDKAYVHDFTLPNQIIAGHDLVISFSYDNDVAEYYNLFLDRIIENDSTSDFETVFALYDQSNSPASVTIPGYLINNEEYSFRIYLYASSRVGFYEKTFHAINN